MIISSFIIYLYASTHFRMKGTVSRDSLPSLFIKMLLWSHWMIILVDLDFFYSSRYSNLKLLKMLSTFRNTMGNTFSISNPLRVCIMHFWKFSAVYPTLWKNLLICIPQRWRFFWAVSNTAEYYSVVHPKMWNKQGVCYTVIKLFRSVSHTLE